MKNKSIYVAYILWLLGGFAGLHLLYLRRDRQAFVYWCTFGGYFGIGAIRDLFRLPSYVNEANYEFNYIRHLIQTVRLHKKPPFSIVRFVAEMLLGSSWCHLWMSALPGDDEPYGFYIRPLKYLAPFAAAIGTWMIGNIGRQEGSFKWPLLGAFAILPFSLINPSANNYSSVTSSILFEWKARQWKRTVHKSNSLCRRFMILSCGWLLFCSMWLSLIYFNGEITYKDGETAKLKDVISNFLNSPMYSEFKKNLRKLGNDAMEHGWSKAWTNMMELLDPLGEYHALKVLGLERGASQEEITGRYKTLTKEWHPDRHKGLEEKEAAQEKFVEIAAAYETLSTIKKRRNRRNKISTPADTHQKEEL